MSNGYIHVVAIAPEIPENKIFSHNETKFFGPVFSTLLVDSIAFICTAVAEVISGALFVLILHVLSHPLNTQTNPKIFSFFTTAPINQSSIHTVLDSFI
mmetsp:Transcript_9360/g.16876  ORF Transcript_9360/g.16876 Transcript_9360/m.16876 type:complete len:99 (-) Transcript_9360:125-421(-)